MIANMNVITPKDNNRLSKMSLIIVIVKIVRIVIRNVVTEIHVVICCWRTVPGSNLPLYVMRTP